MSAVARPTDRTGSMRAGCEPASATEQDEGSSSADRQGRGGGGAVDAGVATVELDGSCRLARRVEQHDGAGEVAPDQRLPVVAAAGARAGVDVEPGPPARRAGVLVGQEVAA